MIRRAGKPEIRAPEARDAPILALEAALPSFEQTGLPQFPIDLALHPGDFVLVESRDARRPAAFADLCSGMLPLASGTIRFLGRDWTEVPDVQIAALRGRIGRVSARGAWSALHDTGVNIMLPQLHHTRRSPEEVTASAIALARRFGLPGLPSGDPGTYTDADLARAALTRAFLGTPALLLLEDPASAAPGELMTPMLDALSAARDRGAAAICFVRDRRPFRGYAPHVTRHLVLRDIGIAGLKAASGGDARRGDTA